MSPQSTSTSLNAPSGAGCFLTSPLITSRCLRASLNAPSGAGCFLTSRGTTDSWRINCLNAPSGAGCFLTPASGSGVVAPLPGAGAPPAPQTPRGAGRQRPYLTTFRRPDAKRHRRTLGHLQPPTSNDVKPKGRRSGLWLWTQPTAVEMEPGSGLGVKGVSHAEPPGRPPCQQSARSHRR